MNDSQRNKSIDVRGDTIVFFRFLDFLKAAFVLAVHFKDIVDVVDFVGATTPLMTGEDCIRFSLTRNFDSEAIGDWAARATSCKCSMEQKLRLGDSGMSADADLVCSTAIGDGSTPMPIVDGFGEML